MAYRDFTLDQVTRLLGITTAVGDLFAASLPIEVPDWLIALLGKRTHLALISEKSRSEFIVAPILLASRDLSPTPLAIFSGHRFDVDPAQGLVGECDFILASSPSVLPLRAPIVTIVEAKRNDIEAGLGQCISQMVAASLFNRAAGHLGPVHGCITTGEVWQFIYLEGTSAIIDQHRYYLDDLSGILAAIQMIICRSTQTTIT